MYKAIRYFTDLEDNSYPYNPGDVFPREGLRVREKRIQDLLTGNNRRGIPVIEKVEETKPDEKEVVAEVATKAADKPVQKADESAAKPKRGRKKKNAD